MCRVAGLPSGITGEAQVRPQESVGGRESQGGAAVVPSNQGGSGQDAGSVRDCLVRDRRGRHGRRSGIWCAAVSHLIVVSEQLTSQLTGCGMNKDEGNELLKRMVELKYLKREKDKSEDKALER